MGFRRGPASGSSSTAASSGVVQLVSPAIVATEGVPANNERLAMFGVLTLHFLPEPGTLLLLGCGALCLALLARRRIHDS